MTDFSTEPVIGHHVGAEVYQPEQIFDTPSEPDERIRLKVGDVEWEGSDTITMTTETFEEMIEWYEEYNG